MKEINLQSIVEAYENMQEELFQKYLDYFGIEIKEREKDDLKIFVEELSKHINDVTFFDKYFFGFKIPQIGKEFDLLRFGENFNINIEIKSKNVGEEGIKKQLVRNKYYLKFLGKENLFFSFISNEKKLYFLDNNDSLVEIEFKKLIEILDKQELKEINNVEELFNPSDYLVSPFNSTENFIEGEYFLTEQQENFKKEILNEIRKKDNLFLGLTGEAGTGKTLLTYDIVKDFVEKTIVIHCGYLNEGHEKLIGNYNWNIISISSFKRKYTDIYDQLKNVELIVIDETQRILEWQLDEIIKIAEENKITCIFSYDKKQFLGKWEEKQIDVKEVEKNFKIFNLTNKIRTNKEISHFIKGLLEKNRKITANYNIGNINVLYFKSQKEAKLYIDFLISNDWKFIEYTPSNRHLEIQSKMSIYNIKGLYGDNAHTVIGQEFDKIIVIIDENFFYDDKGKISIRYPNPYYLPIKMFFQIITRVKQELFIIVINNDEIMNRCLELLKR